MPYTPPPPYSRIPARELMRPFGPPESPFGPLFPAAPLEPPVALADPAQPFPRIYRTFEWIDVRDTARPPPEAIVILVASEKWASILASFDPTTACFYSFVRQDKLDAVSHWAEIPALTLEPVEESL